LSAPVTTRHTPAEFNWSYSKLKNYEACPKRCYEIDIAKNVEEPQSDQLTDGNLAHKALAERIGKHTPLPDKYKDYEPWAVKMLTPPGKLLVEQKLAFRRDLSPCAYFDRKVWYRGVCDVIKLVPPVALIVDWKTGKIVEDATQLALMAQCVFSHYPEIDRVRTEFVWLKEDATTRQDFKRTEMVAIWNNILPRVAQFENANKTMNFPPKPGPFCLRWCAVTACPHNGVRS
jgi:hypothetical protein